MRIRTGVLWIVGGFHGLLWAGGIFSYVAHGEPPADAAWAAPMFLVSAAWLAWVALPVADWPWLVWVGAVGFASEAIGVVFGAPYGAYRYTETLGPQWLSVPWAMGGAWMALAAYVRDRLNGCAARPWPRAVAAAAWMTALDLLIDPVAAGPLGYWRWLRPGGYYGVPPTNFFGWFVVGMLVFAPAKVPVASCLPVRLMGVGIILFFGVLAVSFEQVGPALAAVALLALDLAAGRWPAGRTE